MPAVAPPGGWYYDQPLTGFTLTSKGEAATADAECRHYFVKQNGTWTCTMCGATR
jgi:hypothetical protein